MPQTTRSRSPLVALLAACALLTTLLVLGAPSAPAQAWAVADDDWLGIINAYRRQSGLPEVRNDGNLSAGARNHSCWMLANGIAHHESPGTWGYSAAGDRAGRNGNLSVHSSASFNARQHIDQWMGGPFHAIGILRPGLLTTGFGLCTSPPSYSSSYLRSAATLDVLSGLDAGRGTSSPIVFPGNGARTSLNRFQSETPDPRAFCGWSGRTVGLPLLAMMPGGVSWANASLRGPNGAVPTCTLHAGNTSGTASAILRGNNAISVIPAVALAPGTYTASVSSSGGSVTWSFTVDPEAQLLGPPEPTPPNTTALGSPVGFKSVTPTRIADSRERFGLTRLPAKKVVRFKVAGKGGIPTNALSLSANFTAVNGAAPGFLTVYNCGALPTLSTLNFRPREAAPNQSIVALAGGDICLYANKAVDLVIDVNGYTSAGAGDELTVISPDRILDSRNGSRLRANTVSKIQIAGRRSVPAHARSAVLNITSVQPSKDGWIRAFPCGNESSVSSVNPQFRSNRPNSAIVPLSADGAVCLRSNVDTDVVLDVTGWIGDRGVYDFQLVQPLRLADTRSTHPGLNPFADAQRLTPGRTLKVRVAGNRGVPAAARGASLNVVAVGAGQSGWVRVEPCGASSPISTVNFERPEAIANGTNVALSGDGSVCITVNKPTHVVVDITGIWR